MTWLMRGSCPVGQGGPSHLEGKPGIFTVMGSDGLSRAQARQLLGLEVSSGW